MYYLCTCNCRLLSSKIFYKQISGYRRPVGMMKGGQNSTFLCFIVRYTLVCMFTCMYMFRYMCMYMYMHVCMQVDMTLVLTWMGFQLSQFVIRFSLRNSMTERSPTFCAG